MKLSLALAPIWDVWFVVRKATPPTVSAVIRNPRILLKPRELNKLFFSYVWDAFSAGVDEMSRPIKVDLIPYASGTVLDLGAGHGHSAFYLNTAMVTKYIALEPNVRMHDKIRKNAASVGFTEENGSMMILSCGAEEADKILAKLDDGTNGGQVDTIISILSLCTVPSPRQTIESLAQRVLKPGGQFLFYEHVSSPRPDVVWWQKKWAPIWALAFDGCWMGRESHEWLATATTWDMKASKTWGKPGETEEHLFWHQVGRYVKAK